MIMIITNFGFENFWLIVKLYDFRQLCQIKLESLEIVYPLSIAYVKPWS